MAINQTFAVTEDAFNYSLGVDIGMGSDIVTLYVTAMETEAPAAADITGVTELSLMDEQALNAVAEELSASLENVLMAAYGAMPEQLSTILSSLSGQEVDDVATVEEAAEELTEQEIEELQELAE